MKKIELSEEELRKIAGGSSSMMKTRLICNTRGCEYTDWALGDNLVGTYHLCPSCKNNSLYGAWAQPCD